MESAASGSRKVLDSTTAVSREALKSASVSADRLIHVTQGVLASALSADLNSMLAGLANGPATIYDKAMDAEYLATNIGGGNHRLFDGGHTIAGAFEAVKGASTEDSIIHPCRFVARACAVPRPWATVPSKAVWEGLGFVQGMFRDLTTSKGLPLASWDKATYDHAASFLETRFQLSREWFNDLNSYTAAELLGGSIGILALVFQWNRADTESFSRMVGSMGMAAALSANPLLLVISVVAFARAFQRARLDGKYGDLLDGSARGAVVATLTIVAVAQVTTIGGPVGLSFLVSLVVGILASKAVSHVSVTDISREVAGSVASGSKRALDAAAGGSKRAMESAASGSRIALDSTTAASRKALKSTADISQVLAERAKAAAVEIGSLTGSALPALPGR